MKTLTIYKRTITERTQYRQYRFKETEQVTIVYGDKFYQNHNEDITNPRLRVKFQKVLTTRRKDTMQSYINTLGRSNADKWQKSILEILEG